jgi:RNA polymerase sigma-70 factor, ECF subfamily
MTEVEKDLLEDFREGDPEAFDKLVRRYQDPLTGFFFRNCWDRYLAEDLVQEVFIRMIKAADRYEASGKLTTFVFKIARNLWIDKTRQNKVKPRPISMDKPLRHQEEGTLGQTIAAPPACPAADLVHEEEHQRLRQAYLQLPDGQRMVFELAVYQDLPYREISASLGIPVGTVKSRMFHALRTLRSLMEEEEAPPGRRS